MTRKTGRQLDREIETFLRSNPGGDDARLYWPGGDGGGGRRKSSKSGAVVRPHRRTSAQCTKCGQFHTMAEHAKHGKTSTPVASPKPERRGTPRVKSNAKSKVKSKTGAKTKRSTATPGLQASPAPSPGPRAPRDAVDLLREAIRQVPPEGRFGWKVFIIDIWKAAVRLGLGMTLDEFKRWLVTLNRDGVIQLARADLVGAMDRDRVQKSEIGSLGATFHFILDDEALPPISDY